jgi:hypothetical protein
LFDLLGGFIGESILQILKNDLLAIREQIINQVIAKIRKEVE